MATAGFCCIHATGKLTEFVDTVTVARRLKKLTILEQIKIGNIVITGKTNPNEWYPDGGYWLTYNDGEGVLVHAKVFEEMIQKYYDDTF